MKPQRVNGSPVLMDYTEELKRLTLIQERYLKLIKIIDQLRKPGESSEQTLNRVLQEQQKNG